MVKYVDIDNTICVTDGMNYVDATSDYGRIDIVNRWYDEGHKIVYYTARGAASVDQHKKDMLRLITIAQLEAWRCKYHELRMDKPLYDELWDDRAFNASDMR